jgi:SagB-type dehydrogenase family enzyme
VLATMDIEPLVAGTVRRNGDAVAIALAGRLVRVQGDPDLAMAVIADCDGRTSLQALVAKHGEAAAELASVLLEHGALVDGSEAWRVFHPQGSAGTALGRAVDAATLASLTRRRYRPPLVNGHDLLALEPIPGTTVPALCSTRRSTRAEDATYETTYEQVSTILVATHRLVEGAADQVAKGAAPSAGALHPLIVHLLARRPLGPLPAGIWWLDPVKLALARLRDCELTAAPLFLRELLADRLLAAMQPIVFLSLDLAGPSRKYGPRGYRYALMEAGAAMQSAALTAAEIGVPFRPIGGFDDRRVSEVLRLPEHAVPVLVLALGA